MATINIKGLERAVVLMALHDAAVPKALHGGYPDTPMARDEADACIEESASFSYVNGRALFFSFVDDEVHVGEYDARNGRGCAERALAPLIAKHMRDTTPEDPEGDKRFAESIAAMGGLVSVR